MIKTNCIFTAMLPLSAAFATSASSHPNVVLFLVDDMGLMDTSVPFLADSDGIPQRYPLNDIYRTPNMERMAEQGVRFSRFYAQSVSSPTRASLMTGQNSTRHHTTTWILSESNNCGTYGPTNWNWEGIKKADETLPRALQRQGYRTIHVGKAHYGPIGSEGENPLNIGFDINIGGSSIGQPGSYYGEWGYGHIKGNKKRAVDGLEKYHGTDTFITEALTLEANAAMEQAVADGQPFFLNMCHYAVHAPFEVDPRFEDNYKNMGLTKPEIAYATLIEGIDKSLGDIMVKLRELGVAENTLVLFMGDNGSDAPINNQTEYHSSAPLRGKKGTEYEGGVRTAFLAAWATPAEDNVHQRRLPIAQGTTQMQLATVYDMYPTILYAAQAVKPRHYAIDGFNLRAQFAGKKLASRPDQVLMHFPHQHRGSYYTSFIRGEWKLIYRYQPATPDSPVCELYHLTSDPFEQHDVAATHTKLCTKMIKAMNAQLVREQAQYPVTEAGEPIVPIP